MTEFAKEVLSVNLEDEMRRSYLDYAMSVIVGRALPDARDGLKPVHRRILYAMSQLNNVWNRPYIKCARVVGDVIGKYHPHGDSAAYDALVRMAQDFSMRHVLVDGQGNFGSVDGDPAAAMRYTECRMARLTSEMLADIDSETVDFVPNYDEKDEEPVVLPTRVPQLLVNGSAGIAVGLATNIPPHNLSEVIDGCIAVIDNPDIDIAGLMQLIPAPDFPTAGLILDAHGLAEAYATGRGRIVIRARTSFETVGNDKQAIIVTELPYQVNKARLQERIAELVKEKKIEGISEIRDESDKDGMRVYIELKRGENADVVLNNLFQQTQLQVTFGINMVALDGGQPKTLSLKSLLEIFVRHRREVVTRRTRYLLRKARERAHILEGLAVALANIDEMIELIRSSPNSAEAKQRMMARTWDAGLVTTLLAAADSSVSRPEDLSLEFGIVDNEGQAVYRLSDAQASAILEMRLSRLTGLEQDKIHDEFKELLASILDYLDILASEPRLLGVIRGELLAIKEQYGEERRTEITTAALNMAQEDLIAPMDMVVTLSHEGYVKSVPLAEYQAQKRGGRGKLATANKQEDFVDRLWVAHTHDWLLCFGSTGKVYKLRVFELPTGSRGSRGKPFVNLLPLEQGEKISAVLPIKKFEDEPEQTRYIFMATRLGTVKKTELGAFANIRSNGIIALDLRVDDSLVGVALTTGNNDVLMFSDAGRVIRFSENDVRSMGRTATGVRGMRLVRRDESSEESSEAPVIDGDIEVAEAAEDTAQAQIIALIVVSPETEGQAAPDILTVSENGYGKRTPIEQFPLRGRGGMGVIAQALTDKTGNLIGAIEVGDEHQVMLISESANLIRFKTTDVRSMGRNTQGVRLMKPNAGDRLVSVDRIAIEADDEAAADDTAAPLEGPANDASE
ncbi:MULTISPECIES: DNA gyrase subunit A [Hydrocarboniphaga]|uniref:DNA gyrase subunit A n=1 Tax=Hydrocarboniphaga effusa AP103 TaxID=1172194 RepID=I8HWB8_9GAMM|nr:MULTISPECIES: DNA gyrase subunit A [Hydrocarboniphaga]EIT67611.1 DNA gyrase, A subunit [Hydrocarboniphaga effusa AP103]MDZ4080196.1 DNA gyrase subunit A [Hydrocarboniphaga sp.]